MGYSYCCVVKMIVVFNFMYKKYKNKHLYALLLCCCAAATCCTAQTTTNRLLLPQLQLTYVVGTHVNKAGISAGAAWGIDRYQLNMQVAAYYCLSNIGAAGAHYECQVNTAALVGWGKRYAAADQSFFDPLSRHIAYSQALGYAYRWYIDGAGTSQQTGAVAWHSYRWRLLIENDLLAGKGSDKYRTAAFTVGYQTPTWQLALNNLLFTGNPRAKPNHKVRNDPQYPARFGYYWFDGTPHSSCSNGVLAVQFSTLVTRSAGYGSTIFTAQVGIDAEQIRHQIQNKWIHDMPIVPTRYNKARNPHVPMIDANGKPYLFRPDQQIRLARCWLLAGYNNGLLY